MLPSGWSATARSTMRRSCAASIPSPGIRSAPQATSKRSCRCTSASARTASDGSRECSAWRCGTTGTRGWCWRVAVPARSRRFGPRGTASCGLDPSLLAAAAARVMSAERIHTYSVKSADPGYDESPHAEAVTHHIRTIHHVVTADDRALERAFDHVIRSLAEPVGDPAILPTFLLAESARAHVKVVLSGEGADELFGGYPTYLGHKAAGWYLGIPGRAALRWLVNRLPTSTGKVTLEFLLKQFVAGADLPLVRRHLTWFGALGPDERVLAWAGGLLSGFPADPSLNRVLWP